MEQIVRLVIVVDADHERPEEEAFRTMLYAETADGRRIRDPRWSAGWVSGVLFSFGKITPQDRLARARESARTRMRELEPHRLGSLAAALGDVGIQATPDELHGLPVVVERTAAADARVLDSAAGRLSPHVPPPKDAPPWVRASRNGCAVVAGAFLPRSLNRYRIWQSGSRRLRLFTLMAEWLVGAWAIGRRSGSPVPARRGVRRRVDRGSRDQD